MCPRSSRCAGLHDPEALGRLVLGDHGSATGGVAPVDQPEPQDRDQHEGQQAEQHPGQHGDDRVVARGRLRVEGAVDETDREAEVLTGAERRHDSKWKPPSVSLGDRAGVGRALVPLVARDIAVQAGVHAVGEVHVGGDAQERLRPAGAVDVPVELLVRFQSSANGRTTCSCWYSMT